jgi:formylglycine-generating enzyme required for sulfatase activity
MHRASELVCLLLISTLTLTGCSRSVHTRNADDARAREAGSDAAETDAALDGSAKPELGAPEAGSDGVVDPPDSGPADTGVDSSADNGPADTGGALCNNGKLDPGEDCEPALPLPSGANCVTAGFVGGTLACDSASCKFDSGGCTLPRFPVTATGATLSVGSPTSEPCRGGTSETQHSVTLTEDFEIDTYEVTQQHFEAVMGYNPSLYASTDPNCTWSDCSCPENGACRYCRSNDCSRNPVDSVTWHEAQAYCNTLSKTAGLTQCFDCTGSGLQLRCEVKPLYGGNDIVLCPGFRLPTEVEFERAYRAGTTTAFYNGPWVASTSCNTNDKNQDKIGWGRMNTSGNGAFTVGQKLPNALGLYDMAGNVAEWCHDWYTSSPAGGKNPAGPTSGSKRTTRGGSWANDPRYLRAAARLSRGPDDRHWSVGFRCVRSK